MAYTIQALLAVEDLFLGAPIDGASIVSLRQGYGIMPLTTQIRKVHSIPLLPLTEGEPLPEQIVEWGLQLSATGFIAYIEAEFFGGEGTQGSALWHNGQMIEKPWVGEYAINIPLREMGVEKGDHSDRFDALGLGRCRSTDAWVEQLDGV